MMFPAFLNLESRRVVVVGGGPVAAGKLDALLAAGADVTMVAPDVRPEIDRLGVTVLRRPFEEADLDGVWWVVAAAPKGVNRQVLAAAEARRVFVNAVDDPDHATAYLGGVVRRHGVTVAISTAGRAPALAGLLREALDVWLPGDLDAWMSAADDARRTWKTEGVPMEQRRPQLLEVLNRLYADRPAAAHRDTEATEGQAVNVPVSRSLAGTFGPEGSAVTVPALKRGHVSLVGAGPGDAELWTVRGVRRLEEADLVLYDALVDVDALRRVTKAQCFCVGKRARRDSVPQETIHRLMIRAAKRGKRVVRLKGGDPFVFGRGGEEALGAGDGRRAVRGRPRRDHRRGGGGTRRNPGDPSGYRVGVSRAGRTYVGRRRRHAEIGAAEYGVDDYSDGRRFARGPCVEADGARLVGRHTGGDRVRGVDAGRLDVDWGARATWRGGAARRPRRRAGRWRRRAGA